MNRIFTRAVALICLTALVCVAGVQCVVLRASGQDAVPPDVQEHRFGRVVYEMINWQNQNEENDAGGILLATLGASADFQEFDEGVGGDDWFVQIVLEPLPGKKEFASEFLDRPSYFFLKHGNGILFGQTFFTIPKAHYEERNVKFAVWRQGMLQKEYAYESNAWVLIGWLGLFLIVPSESTYLRYDMSRVARQFLADAARDGIMSTGGRP